jgi:hypothetical protein
VRRRIVSSVTSFALLLSLLTAISIVTAPPANANITGTGSGLFALLKNGAENYATIPTDMRFADRCGSAILTTVDFDWSTTMPTGTSCGTLSGSLRTNYSAMITGYLLAPVTGNYTFKSRNDDGFVVNLNGQTVISSWTGQGALALPSFNATSSQVSLIAGNIYPIRIFYAQGAGSAQAHLYWNYGSGDQIIPQSNLGLTASDLGTGCAVGESQFCPADNARQIKAINGTNTNGRYWINVGGVSTNTYSLMDSNIDGGGWMLGMKGKSNAQSASNAFTYDANYWTSTATLNAGVNSYSSSPVKNNQGQTCTSGNGVTCAVGDDNDAKLDVFNYSAATEALVIWPDVTGRSDGYRYTNASTYGFTWKESLTSSSTFVNNVSNGYNSSFGCPTTTVTLLTLFTNALRCKIRNANSTSPYDSRGTGTPVFSYQNDVNFFGFNYRGLNDVKKARFGFGWNENGGMQENSNDVVGGIGIGGSYNPTYGAGDFNGCCATGGINRRAGFELYARNSALTISGTSSVTAIAGTASNPWTVSSPSASTGASATRYIVKTRTPGVNTSAITINSSGVMSVSTALTGGVYSLAVSMIDTYGQVASTPVTLTVADANLSSLSISSGTLAPVFASATTSYTATVAHTVTSMTVTPTAVRSNATYRTNVNSAGLSSAINSGTTSGSLALNYGSNTILIVVTDVNGSTTRTYTLTVTRDCPAPTTTTDRAFTVLAFTTVGTCSWANTVGITTVDALVVGGGGGAGHNSGGGGSGGGVNYQSAVSITETATIVVGAGGAAGTSSGNGTAGGQSLFNGTTANGGNAGIGWNSGSAGGAFVAGSGLAGASGAGGNGTRSSSSSGSAGSAGPSISITGAATNYAGGGGGGGWVTASNGGAGGAGGGGAGGGAGGTSGAAGTANTGGGGGSSSQSASVSGAGGSGVVILRYITNAPSISTQPNSATVKSFTEATFSVETSTTPAGVNRTFQWQVSTDSGGSFSNISNADGSSYVFTAIAANDNNKRYRVVITDTATDTSLARSTTSDAATLTVSAEVAPEAPTITGITVSSAQLSVAFTAGTNLGSPITKYQYSTDNGDTWKDRATVDTGSPLVITTVSASASSLVNATTYNVRIRAFNSIAGTESSAVSATPYAAPTLAAPTTGLSGTAMIAYTLTISAAAGGSGNYSYSDPGNKLPTGLSINAATRVISGTPTVAGTFSGIQITVTDTTSGLTAQSSAFTITIASGTQLPISIFTRFGTGGQPHILAIQGGSGIGALTYTLDPLVQPSCLLSGPILTPNFPVGTSGACFVKATKAADAAFTQTSSATTAIFFTAYVPVIEQTLTCPPGTTPSAPTGIGVRSCIQVLSPVSPTAGDAGAAPKITSLSATSGLVGATITITGTGFSTVTRVQFGAKSTTTFTATSTTITVDVPTGATRGRVIVFSPTGSAMAAQIFTVTVVDTQAPGFTGGSVNTSTPTQLTLNFDETIDGTGVLATSFAVSVNTVSRSITNISISGTTITLTLSSAVSAGQSVQFTYTSPGDSTSVKDAAGNKTATIALTGLTNSLS